MTITADAVKQLRERTGAGMMECKKALVETQGNLDAAAELMRKQGLAKADKKATRVAAEGVIAIAVAPDGKSGAMVEVNCETDFVAREQDFRAFAQQVATVALAARPPSLAALMNLGLAGAESVDERRCALVAKIGENMSVRRTIAIGVNPGVVSAYVHNATSPELGKIGVLVALKSTADKSKLAALGKQIAMHVAAAAPLALTPAHLSKEVVDRERAIQTEIAKQSGKPDNVIEKMMEGRMRKFYEETVLLQQIFVIDGETRIDRVIEKASKDFGAPVEIAGFIRFQVGEGMEKTDSDFADEVKQMAGH